MSAWLRSLRFPWKLQSIKLKRDIGVDLFSSVIRMFLFFFRAGLWQWNSFIINIFVLRLIFRGQWPPFILFFAFFVSGRQSKGIIVITSKRVAILGFIYLSQLRFLRLSTLTLSHRSLSNIFLRRQGEEPVCIINFSVTTLLKLIKEFNLIFQQWRSQSTSYCRSWNSGRFQPFYCVFAKWKISNHNGLFISRNSELLTWNRRRSNWSGGPLVTQR